MQLHVLSQACKVWEGTVMLLDDYANIALDKWKVVFQITSHADGIIIISPFDLGLKTRDR